MKFNVEELPTSAEMAVPQYEGGNLATFRVEAWCDRHVYMWHWLSGSFGSNKDITMVSFSLLFSDMCSSWIIPAS